VDRRLEEINRTKLEKEFVYRLKQEITKRLNEDIGIKGLAK